MADTDGSLQSDSSMNDCSDESCYEELHSIGVSATHTEQAIEAMILKDTIFV